jgi:hypothetical protein
MRRIRVYIDTSVFGGVNDEEFARSSKQFLSRLKNGEFTIVISAELI